MLAAWLLGCREAVRWVSRLEGNKAAAVWQCVWERDKCWKGDPRMRNTHSRRSLSYLHFSSILIIFSCFFPLSFYWQFSPPLEWSFHHVVANFLVLDPSRFGFIFLFLILSLFLHVLLYLSLTSLNFALDLSYTHSRSHPSFIPSLTFSPWRVYRHRVYVDFREVQVFFSRTKPKPSGWHRVKRRWSMAERERRQIPSPRAPRPRRWTPGLWGYQSFASLNVHPFASRFIIKTHTLYFPPNFHYAPIFSFLIPHPISELFHISSPSNI